MALFNPECKKSCFLEDGKSCEFFAYCQNNYNKNNTEKPKNEKAVEIYLKELMENVNNAFQKLNLQIEEVNTKNEAIDKELIKLKKEVTNGKRTTARATSKK